MRKSGERRFIALVLSLVMICTTLFSNAALTVRASQDTAQGFAESYSDDIVQIDVNAPAGALPEGTSMVVIPIVKQDMPEDTDSEEAAGIRTNNEIYDAAYETIVNEAGTENLSVKTIRAYAVTFEVLDEMTNTWTEVQPNGNVSVDITYGTPDGVSQEAEAKVKYLDEISVYAVAWYQVVAAHQEESTEVSALEPADWEYELDEETAANEVLDGIATNPGTMQTESTRGKIAINLFDYVVQSGGKFSEKYNLTVADEDREAGEGINRGHYLKFYSSCSVANPNSINKPKGLNQNIVSAELSKNGYPVLSKQGESLEYLFDPNEEIHNTKRNFTNLDYLFYKDIDGYYTYDSDVNYAFLDIENDAKNFTVYNNYTNQDETSRGFFPFTSFGSSGVASGPASSAPLGSNKSNHYFGMTMEAEFMQPKNGMINGEPMIFEFSGDDDVWIYVDNKLVLDLGGIHAKTSGKVDFSTGKITITDPSGAVTNTSLANIFNKEPIIGVNEKGTFNNYSIHNIKLYYLERGNYKSNCSMKFNLPVVDNSSVYVGKSIGGVASTEFYEDLSFRFRLNVGEDESDLKTYANQNYRIIDLNTLADTGEAGQTDSNGEFELKHNQAALFDDIPGNYYYQTTELDVNKGEFDEVKVNGTKIDLKPAETRSTGYLAQSQAASVGGVRGMVFENNCSVANNRALSIEKRSAEGSESLEGQEFTFIVSVEGKPFTREYKVGEETYTAENGYIKLAVNQTAVISSLPAGTTFDVVEDTEILGELFAEPEYKVSTADNVVIEKSAAGVIASGYDAEVIITNRKYSEEESIEKKLSYDKSVKVKDWDERTYEITLKAHSKLSSSEVVEKVLPVDTMMVLDISGSMKWTFNYKENAGMATSNSEPKNIIWKTFKDCETTLDKNKVYFTNSNSNKLKIDYSKPVLYDETVNKWRYRVRYDFNTDTTFWAYCEDTKDMMIGEDNESRISALKTAVTQFIRTAASEADVNSKMGQVSFDDYAIIQSKLKTIDSSDAISKLYDGIAGAAPTNGSTNMAAGLEKALDELKSVKGTNSQYAILFSDGEPNVPTHSAKESAIMAAKALRDAGVKVFTISTGDANYDWLRDNIAYQPTDTYALSASDAAELNAMFKKIQETITHTKDIKNASVTDVIDLCFQVMDGEKVVTNDMIKEAQKNGKKGYELQGGYVTLNEEGGQVVQWEEQTLPYGGNGDEWKQVVQIKAKEDYIGGNNVTTNGALSGIYAPSVGTVAFEQPTVNVKVRFDVKRAEDVIFYGDNINSSLTDDFIAKNIFDVDNPSYNGTVFSGVDKSKFDYKWYTDEGCTQEVSLADIRQGSQESSYYMKVVYTGFGGASTDESLKNTNNKQVTDDNSRVIGKYSVHVVKGQLTITKQIDEQYTDVDKLNAKQSFVFRIDRRNEKAGAVKDTYYVTLMFDAFNNKKSISETISGLKKGYYTVTEQTDWSSKYGEPEITDNYGQNTGKDIYIGERLRNTTDQVLPANFYGTENTPEYAKYAVANTATVDFMNKIKSNWKWLSDVAAVVNEFIS